MSSRRRLLPYAIPVILLITLIAGVLSYYLISKEATSPESSSSSNVTHTGKERVFIADLNAFVDMETKESIERVLYTNIDRDQPDLYTGTIRKGSYSENLLASKQIMTTFLVDVEPIKITYDITLFNRPQDRPSVNIVCAPKEQQMVPTTVCEDTHSHE